MSFRLYASNHLESLSVELVSRFSQRKGRVFQPDYVVTQTDGMGNWLKWQVASHTKEGIAANIRFLTPNDLIEKVYRLLGGVYQNSFSSKNLCWLIFSILGETSFRKRFPVIAAYYEYDTEVKRLALAQKLADLFDQYQIYRPEMITGWNSEQETGQKDEDWQQFLWTRVRSIAGDRLADKTLQWKFIMEQVKDPARQGKLQASLPEIHLFGISILAPYHLQVLSALADHIDVSFYLLNPAPQVYWYDTLNEKQVMQLTARGVASREELITGNNLLTGWGKVLKETFALLFEREELINAYTDTGSMEPAASTLLRQIQYDIYNNLNNSERESLNTTLIADGSVVINSCYTIAREVECLYNYLVHLVDKKQVALSPRDIVVMVTDIDAYAPYIKAVFDNAPYRFPYSISDESFEGSDNMISALQRILEINADNFTAENVLQLLDAVYIRNRFGVSNLPLIRRVIEAAGVRFGIEGSTLDDTVYVSWKYGLKRMMYGLCIAGEPEYTPHDGEESLFPLDVVEGADSYEIVRFVHFVEMLMESVERRREPRTVPGWVEYITWVLNSLVYEAEDQVEEDYNVLLKQLASYNAVQDIVPELISFDVFAHHFIDGLSASGKTASFIRGGITFCSLIPMRSIPFKVIALLGLNFDKFPRRDTRTGFDLMEREHRKGDRNVKDNDKHLFLETLLSARDNLYISYLGQSVKDNEPLPPSALVDELLDYIEFAAHTGSVRDMLITRQPLHGFSTLYNDDDPALYNYLGTVTEMKVEILEEEELRPEFNFEEISLESMVRLFRNPFKYYYNTVLDVRYDNNESLLPDTEVFELDKLQQYGLREQMFGEPEEAFDAIRNRMLKTGQLPLKNMASIGFKSLAAEIGLLKNLLAQEGLDGEFQQVEIDIHVGQNRITGSIPLVVGSKMVCITFSKKDLKYFVAGYINFLAGVAAGKLTEMYLVSGAHNAIYRSRSMDVAEAMKQLESLVELFKSGHQAILPFYPDLDLKPSGVAGLVDQSFYTLMDKTVNRPNGVTDEYVLHESGRSWFKSPEAGNVFRSVCAKLIEPLGILFPTAKFNGK